MNILLLSYGVPYPPDSGPRVKTYQLIRHLAGRHRVSLVCLDYDGTGAARAPALQGLCADVRVVRVPATRWRALAGKLARLFGGRPAILARCASDELHGLLAQMVAEAAAAGRPFDLVHVDQIVMAPFAERLALPRLLDAHNAVWKIYADAAEQQGWLARWLGRHEAARLRAYEGRICAEFEAVLTVSEADRAALAEAAGGAGALGVLPLGVDSRALPPVQRAPEAQGVLSLAAPGWPPNAEGIAWFAREVFPLVRRAAPASTLFICGAQPRPELLALPERAPGIEVTGFVNPIPYLERAAVLIAPLRSSGGMRVMLLEALARGVPVVATTLACAGLELAAGEHLLIADSPSEFADAVALLLRDPELGARIAAAGRRRVIERYDWRALYPAIDLVYARITAQGAPHSEETPAGQAVAIS
jgi:glycosyltransferase involved in cell wall biosynthesis